MQGSFKGNLKGSFKWLCIVIEVDDTMILLKGARGSFKVKPRCEDRSLSLIA